MHSRQEKIFVDGRNWIKFAIFLIKKRLTFSSHILKIIVCWNVGLRKLQHGASVHLGSFRESRTEILLCQIYLNVEIRETHVLRRFQQLMMRIWPTGQLVTVKMIAKWSTLFQHCRWEASGRSSKIISKVFMSIDFLLSIFNWLLCIVFLARTICQ